jgi:outer membrane lipoprotein SlyB
MRTLARFAVLGIFVLSLSAARITLRDGTVVYGQFVSGSQQYVVVQDQNGMRHRYDINQVQLIDFGAVNTPAGDRDRQYNESRNYQGNNSSPQDRNNTYQSQNNQPERRYGNRFALLQPGTQIAVRADERIDSRDASEGRTYTATISQDVIGDDGRVAIPRGSQAALVIRRINEGGTFNNGSFTLDLDSVSVNGRRYLVSTADLKQSDANGIGANKRTGEMVGGGAVLGTLLGAIAGGGKGAAIGAIAGAAAGGGTQVLTKGHDIRVPAETELTFKLDQPLELREAR